MVLNSITLLERKRINEITNFRMPYQQNILPKNTQNVRGCIPKNVYVEKV